MSATQPAVTTPLGRRGPLFAAIWLFFLADPLVQGWQHIRTVAGVVGLVTTLVFGASYMAIWMRMRRERHQQLMLRPPAAQAVAWFAALAVMCAVMIATLGEHGTAGLVYCAVTAIILFRPLTGAAVVAAVAVVAIVLGLTHDAWGSQVGLVFSIFAASLAVFGITQMLARNVALIEAHQENAELAVENERTRFARDLHDILGHSLTVITVKAELAQKLLDVDHERARAELADLERLSRDALADVRRAVAGYRELTLPGELASARTALAAAEIEADLPNSTDEVPSELRELFAWTVREGVTNVIRHSGARHCSVRLDARRVEVSDDGRGAAHADTSGSGLLGLRERAAAVGATVVTRSLAPGFSLRVEA